MRKKVRESTSASFVHPFVPFCYRLVPSHSSTLQPAMEPTAELPQQSRSPGIYLMGRFRDFCDFIVGFATSDASEEQANSNVGVKPAAFSQSWRWTGGVALVMGFAVLIRLCTGLHSYSGMHTPPKFGDYEAQRHWMEVTLHLPASQWYVNSTANDLQWWGLDYPPLTAFQSLLHGRLLHALCPEAVALETSRGFESAYSKVLMRWTVLSSDLLVFFPAAYLFVTSPFISSHPIIQQRPGRRLWLLALLLLQPALILIDHGHFQYNCISLGLALAAAAAVVRDWPIAASVLFCLALNHKHMALYFAPAFFAHLLGRCLHSKRPLLLFSQLGLTVVATFLLCWLPFLSPPACALQVLRRLFPLQRGLFEDHVANFWCATSPLLKWKRLLSVPQSARLALLATVAAVLPSMLQQLRAPSHQGFLLAMLNSSMAFFLFSFQVHEKSILLPLLPASLLALHNGSAVAWLAPAAAFSMFDLLKRDGLTMAYAALQLLYLLLFPVHEQLATSWWPSSESPRSRLWLGMTAVLLAVVGVFLHVAAFTIQPPRRFPYLHAALHISLAFLLFISSFVWSNVQQWRIQSRKKKKE